MVLANSEKGKDIIKDLRNCFIEKRELKEAIKLNHNLIVSTNRPAYRDELIEAFNNPNLSLKEINKQFKLVGTGLKDRVKDLLISTGLFWVIKSIINKLRSI